MNESSLCHISLARNNGRIQIMLTDVLSKTALENPCHQTGLASIIVIYSR